MEFGHWNLFGILGIWLLVLALIFPEKIKAQSFSSDNYRIEWGNFNVTSGKKTSARFQITDTVGQLAPGRYTSSGYILKSGFQYIYDTFKNFTFSISDLDIPLGTLVPGVGTSAFHTISITSPYGNGYQVMAHQNHPLTQGNGLTLPDTTCNAAAACTEITTGTWTDSAAYGFGFQALGINSNSQVTGVGTSNYFPTTTSYRQLANYSASPPESSQIIMSEDSPASNRTARVTYRANISSVQPSGDYQNAVIFTAVPKY